MNFAGNIGMWYEKYRRTLPWRQTTDPYRVWLSEVILQQTRVEQGMPYYQEFVRSFPNVHSLAAASEDEVLKKWQGLGYYSRARNLLFAARQVVDQWKGAFPKSYGDLLSLKGVGTYTAAAIASICFGEPKAVVDGNVARVIARLYGVEEPVNSVRGSREIASLADGLVMESVREGRNAGTHNQAMMEFGSLQCTPSSPACETCPLKEGCVAFRTGQVSRLPLKKAKKKPVHRWLYYYIMVARNEVILMKRSGGDIWESLYQFPLVESDHALTEAEFLRSAPLARTRNENDGQGPGPYPARNQHLVQEENHTRKENLLPFTVRQISGTIRHQLSHRTLQARFIHIHLDAWPEKLPSGWIRVPLEQLEAFPVPRLIHRYVESTEFSYLF